jgi:hypothetical protein
MMEHKSRELNAWVTEQLKTRVEGITSGFWLKECYLNDPRTLPGEADFKGGSLSGYQLEFINIEL